MTINTNTLVSITEANQNFSKVARLVDKNGSAVILKNNVPRYIVLEFSEVERHRRQKMRILRIFLRDLLPKNLKHTGSLLNDKTYSKAGNITS